MASRTEAPPPLQYHTICLVFDTSHFFLCQPSPSYAPHSPSASVSFLPAALLSMILSFSLSLCSLSFRILPPPSPLVPLPSSHPSPLQGLVIVLPFASFLTAIVPSTLYCPSYSSLSLSFLLLVIADPTSLHMFVVPSILHRSWEPPTKPPQNESICGGPSTKGINMQDSTKTVIIPPSSSLLLLEALGDSEWGEGWWEGRNRNQFVEALLSPSSLLLLEALGGGGRGGGGGGGGGRGRMRRRSNNEDNEEEE